MNLQKIDEAVALAKKLSHVYIATASGKGMPHITAAARIEKVSEDHVAVTEWFCPGTVANLKENSALAIAVWDSHCDIGFQLLGQLERIDDLAVLDGYAPAIEAEHPFPQTEKQLLIKVEKILDFTLAPHCDLAA
jgi:hypothetical protein